MAMGHTATGRLALFPANTALKDLYLLVFAEAEVLTAVG